MIDTLLISPRVIVYDISLIFRFLGVVGVAGRSVLT